MRISWKLVVAIIGGIALITGIIVDVKSLVSSFFAGDPLSQELEYLRNSPPLKVSKGEVYLVNESNLSFSEIVLEDGAKLSLSPELETVSHPFKDTGHRFRCEDNRER